MKIMKLDKIIGNLQIFRTNNDIHGNGRYIIHYSDIYYKYDAARKIALNCGGRKYRGKDFGGGFIFTANSAEFLAEKLAEEISKQAERLQIADELKAENFASFDEIEYMNQNIY